MKAYIKLFPNSKVHFVDHYKDGENEGKLVHGRFELDGLTMISMDGGGDHEYEFTEGCSLVRLCEDQVEIDKYWEAITKDGEEGRCGWCKDRSGLSWQIIPSKLSAWMADPNNGSKVGKELQAMKKIEISKLERSMA